MEQGRRKGRKAEREKDPQLSIILLILKIRI